MIAKFLPIIGCFSLQQQILKIIFSHVTSPQNAVEGLFKPLIDNSIFDSLKMYEKMSKIQKHVLIYRDIPNSLNRKGKMVYSKGLRYLHFDNKPVDPYPVRECICLSLRKITIEILNHLFTTNKMISDFEKCFF